jgi:quinoprotein dehydrogenase-associated probable ABC transporter substrate-binding protein
MGRSSRDASPRSSRTSSPVAARGSASLLQYAAALGALLAAALLSLPVGAQSGSDASRESSGREDVLKVCADPNNLPQSDKNGSGYENKLAEALARDLGRRVEYTFFPQRMGFVRNTLRARDETTRQYKCDVIIGVPKGYELTATTRPYMRSVYAMVVPGRATGLAQIRSPEDLLKLPKDQLQTLNIGIFARTPATDWLLRNGLLERATLYATQSGDPNEHPANIIERDLASGKIDLAIVWGPVAGFLASRHQGGEDWRVVPFRPDPEIHFDYEIAMGVRFGEDEWRKTLDEWIASKRKDIEQILVSYHIPLLEPSSGDPESAAR